jgi:hypothetical protein
VEITFSDGPIRELCCSRSRLVRHLGAELAAKVCCRLSVLAAAPCLADVPTALPIGLAEVDGRGTYSVALGSTHLLVFRAEQLVARRVPVPAAVSKILIVGPAPVPAVKASKR